jgi:hypothetical protein
MGTMIILRAGMDFWEVHRQDSVRNTYTREHRPAKRPINFSRRWIGGSSSSVRLLVWKREAAFKERKGGSDAFGETSQKRK